MSHNFRPNIIHFSGHGSSKGIYLEDNFGNKKLLEGEALDKLFRYYSNVIKCVILNSCYSESQAFIIAQSIPYVIGTSSEIKDDSAVNFAIGFYTGIKSGSSIENSFELGTIRIGLDEVIEKNIPILLKDGDKVKYISLPNRDNEKNHKEKGLSNFKYHLIFLLILMPIIITLWFSTSNLIPRLITQNEAENATTSDKYFDTTLLIFWHNSGLEKKDAMKIKSELEKQGLSIEIHEHKDKSPPDAVFLGDYVSASLARKILLLLPYEVEYIFPNNYSKESGGDPLGLTIGIGYMSSFESGSRSENDKPVKVDSDDINRLTENNISNEEFHKRLRQIILNNPKSTQ